jgi:hypothetical protein
MREIGPTTWANPLIIFRLRDTGPSARDSPKSKLNHPRGRHRISESRLSRDRRILILPRWGRLRWGPELDSWTQGNCQSLEELRDRKSAFQPAPISSVSKLNPFSVQDRLAGRCQTRAHPQVMVGGRFLRSSRPTCTPPRTSHGVHRHSFLGLDNFKPQIYITENIVIAKYIVSSHF